MTEDKRIKVNFASKGGSFNADQFVPRLKYSYYDTESPMEDMFVSTNYREKENKLSFELLEKISLEVAPISNIISTRIDQVGTFTSRSKYATDGVGFKVMLKDSSKEPTEEQEKTIDLIEKFIENCGLGDDPNRDRFDTFIRKIIRDSLTYDQVNFELEYDVTGQFVQAFEAVDAATIKPALDNIDLKESAYADDIDIRDGEKLAYVQVVDGKIVAGFTADEMAFAVRNPRTSVHSQPYGLSEIETIVRQLTSYLEAEDYNMRFFQQGGMTKGILNIKGEKNGPAPGDRQTLESFKRQWRTQVTGQKGAWKIPVFTLPGELEFINIAQSGGEMVFEKWVNYLINIICGAYKIDPAEINFPNNGGVGGKGSSLFSGDEKKIDNSKAKGLFPLLRFVENTINKFIVSKFNTEDEYVFVFDGIDKESESDQVDLAKKKSESYMTINEVRAEKGLAEIEGGDIIANPYYLQAKQMAPGGDSMDFDFDSYGDDEDQEEPDPSGEETETVDSLFQKSLRTVNKQIEKESLSKAIDKSKLVLVDVDVKGPKGTYKAKRWKSPKTGMEEVKKEISKQGINIEDISFSDKNTKKKVSDNEITEAYMNSPRDKTLGFFIKENYSVSTVGEAKKEITDKPIKPPKNIYDLKNILAERYGEDKIISFIDKQGNKFGFLRLKLNYKKNSNGRSLEEYLKDEIKEVKATDQKSENIQATDDNYKKDYPKIKEKVDEIINNAISLGAYKNESDVIFTNKKGQTISVNAFINRYKNEAYPRGQDIEDYFKENYIQFEPKNNRLAKWDKEPNKVKDDGSFKDVDKDIANRMQYISDKVFDSFTDEEAETLDNYTGYQYEDINKYLSTGKADMVSYSNIGDIKKDIKNLDKIMGKLSLENSINLYRATSKAFFDSLEEGDSIQIKNYSSTSTDVKAAKTFLGQGRKENSVLLEIEAPKGTKGLYIGDNSNYPDEKEFLLQRNCRATITKREIDKDGYERVKIRIEI